MEGCGAAVCLGPDIDTDVIIAGRYLRTKDASVWAAHAFEDMDPALSGRLKGAVIVAGNNFGCGSSREQAPVALREAGVRAVVAPSFARIFFRNAINIGLVVLECGGVACSDGGEVCYSSAGAWVETGGVRYPARELSSRMQDILAAGGLVEYIRGKLL